MAKAISAAVGRWAPNRPSDVKTVQRLLNKAIPKPTPPLVDDGICGRLTIGAINAFQDYHFGPYSHDGRIDPGRRTIQKLNEFYKPGSVPAVPPGPPTIPPLVPPVGGQLSALRTRIIQIATAQAIPPPGKVSDRITIPDPQTHRIVRAGWRQLKNYFDVAIANWSPQVWKIPGYLDGVQIPGKRVPQPGTSGIQWCGIFATWVLIQAGMKVRWILGPGLTLKPTYGNDAHPGDVCLKKGSTRHHFIVITDSDPMLTVNGNSDFQSILIKPIARSEVLLHYKVD